MPKQTGVNYGADLLLHSVGDNPSQRQGPITGFNYDTVPRTQERPLVGAQDVRSYLEWLGQGGGLQNLNALGQGLFGPQGRQTVSDIAHNVQGPVQPLGLGMGGPNEMMGQAMDFLNPMGKVGGLLGTLAGPTAKTANPVARNLAEQLKAQGRSDEDIWRLTAERHDQPWWLGHPDQVPRFEISDEAMKYRPENMPATEYSGNRYNVGTLAQSVEHPELMAAYPDLGAVKNVQYPAYSRKKGSYRAPSKFEDETITLWNSTDPKSVVGHEIQHGIQQREGMSTGGMPELFSAKHPLGQVGAYRSLGGEMDARAVQARQSLTQQERAARPFWMDYDRPLGQMIIRK